MDGDGVGGVVAPGVAHVVEDIGDVGVGELRGGEGGHDAVVVAAVDGEGAAHSLADDAGQGGAVAREVIGVGQRGDEGGEAIAFNSVAVGAVLDVEGFAPALGAGKAAGEGEENEE